MMKNISFIVDKVLDEKEFEEYKNYLQNVAVYRMVEGDNNKKFYITDMPYGLQESIVKTLEKIHHCEINVVLSTIRKATQYLDKNWAIHSDLSVGVDKIPDYGAVFYISQNDQDLSGTALWRHKELGYSMPRDIPQKEMLEISNKDYNNIEKWELSSVIGGIENRLTAYPAEYFHSKFPKQAWGATQKDCRLVAAIFYQLT